MDDDGLGAFVVLIFLVGAVMILVYIASALLLALLVAGAGAATGGVVLGASAAERAQKIRNPGTLAAWINLHYDGRSLVGTVDRDRVLGSLTFTNGFAAASCALVAGLLTLLVLLEHELYFSDPGLAGVFAVASLLATVGTGIAYAKCTNTYERAERAVQERISEVNQTLESFGDTLVELADQIAYCAEQLTVEFPGPQHVLEAFAAGHVTKILADPDCLQSVHDRAVQQGEDDLAQLSDALVCVSEAVQALESMAAAHPLDDGVRCAVNGFMGDIRQCCQTHLPGRAWQAFNAEMQSLVGRLGNSRCGGVAMGADWLQVRSYCTFKIDRNTAPEDLDYTSLKKIHRKLQKHCAADLHGGDTFAEQCQKDLNEDWETIQILCGKKPPRRKSNARQ